MDLLPPTPAEKTKSEPTRRSSLPAASSKMDDDDDLAPVPVTRLKTVPSKASAFE
jgi:hypothetical protein